MTRAHTGKNWLEWLVFGIGLVLVSGVVIFLGIQMWKAPDGPAQIRIELAEPDPRGESFAVPVLVRNDGHETAERVAVLVVLTTADGEVEESEFEIEFLPPGAERRGTAMFTKDPRTGELSGRVKGYQDP